MEANPSYADLRPKRLDITILSAMLITLPFCFFMNLIDEMKKARAPALTVELMKDVVGLREQRRTWALHILAKKRLLPGVIDQAYLEELAYREFVLFERAADQCVSDAMVHRIWVGLEPPAVPPSRPMTLADLEASFEPNSSGEGSGSRASRNKINPNKGKKNFGPAVPDPIQTSTEKKSTIQTSFVPGSKVETPPFSGRIAQTPTNLAPGGEQFQTSKKKKKQEEPKEEAKRQAAVSPFLTFNVHQLHSNCTAIYLEQRLYEYDMIWDLRFYQCIRAWSVSGAFILNSVVIYQSSA